MELAKAYIQIVPSAKGIQQTIQNEIDPPSTGKKVGKGISTGMKTAIATAGIGAVLSKALFSGAELQQNIGGTEAVFADFSKNIQDSASQAYKNMGMSASKYMETANKMGSLFQGSGIEQEKALNLTTSAMQRAADVASVMGISTEMAMESIAGAAKGNFTMMDNLGVAMNVANLEAYALEKGLNFKWDMATQAEKNELAMKMFMDRTNQYAGNFARESTETLSGALGAMKSAFNDFLGGATLGQDVQPLLDNLVNSVIVAAGNLMPALMNIITTLPTSLATALVAFAPLLGPAAADLIMQLATALTTMLPTLLTSGVEILNGLVQGIMSALPNLITSIPTIITSLVDNLLLQLPTIVATGVTLLTSLANDLPNIIQQITEVLPEIIDSVITTLTNNIPLIVDAGVTLFTALITNMPVIIKSLVSAMPTIIKSLIKALLDSIPKFIDAGKELLMGLGDGIGKAVGSVINMAKEACGKVLNSVKSFFGIKSPSRVFMGLGEYLDEGLALGISGNTGIVQKAIDDMAAITTGEMESQLALSATTDYSQFDNNSASLKLDTSNLEYVIEKAVEKVISKLERPIVLNDGTLVSALAGPMDAELGNISNGKMRGW